MNTEQLLVERNIFDRFGSAIHHAFTVVHVLMNYIDELHYDFLFLPLSDAHCFIIRVCNYKLHPAASISNMIQYVASYRFPVTGLLYVSCIILWKKL